MTILLNYNIDAMQFQRISNDILEDLTIVYNKVCVKS